MTDDAKTATAVTVAEDSNAVANSAKGATNGPSAEHLVQYRNIRIVDAITRNYRITVLCLIVGFCVWVAGDTIKAFAGQTTDFAAIVGIFTDSGAGITISLSLTLNVFLGGWAFLERKLRLHKTEDLATRKAAAERLVDQNRSSSDLHPDGSTNPKDL